MHTLVFIICCKKQLSNNKINKINVIKKHKCFRWIDAQFRVPGGQDFTVIVI